MKYLVPILLSTSFIILIFTYNLDALEIDYRKVISINTKNKFTEKNIDKQGKDHILKHGKTILRLSKEYDICPTAIAGIILAENTLNSKIANYFEEYLVKTKILSKKGAYLDRLATATELETANRRLAGESLHDFNFRLNTGLIWTIGICQMSIMRAINLEEELFLIEKRQKKSTREVIKSLLNPEESIKYCAFELAKSRDIYRKVGKDISYNPAILASLYNIGNVEELASKYLNHSNKTPTPNNFGKFVSHHSIAIDSLLSLSAQFE